MQLLYEVQKHKIILFPLTAKLMQLFTTFVAVMDVILIMNLSEHLKHRL